MVAPSMQLHVLPVLRLDSGVYAKYRRFAMLRVLLMPVSAYLCFGWCDLRALLKGKCLFVFCAISIRETPVAVLPQCMGRALHSSKRLTAPKEQRRESLYSVPDISAQFTPARLSLSYSCRLKTSPGIKCERCTMSDPHEPGQTSTQDSPSTVACNSYLPTFHCRLVNSLPVQYLHNCMLRRFGHSRNAQVLRHCTQANIIQASLDS